MSNKGRTATVRTDDRRTVTVLVSEASEPNAMTTVDRTFEVGVRYEFHPTNEGDPYRDNACTATHAIGRASGGASAGPSKNGGSLVALWIGTGVVVAATITVWYLRRRVQHRLVQPADSAAWADALEEEQRRQAHPDRECHQPRLPAANTGRHRYSVGLMVAPTDSLGEVR